MENGTDDIKFQRLYEIIESYPRGVAAELVEKIYKMRFGKPLEDDWLFTVANAFDIDDQNPGLTVLYIRQKKETNKQIHFKSDNSLVDQHTITINESSDQQPWVNRRKTSRMSAAQLSAQLGTVELVENRRLEVVISHFCINNGELNIFVRLSTNEEKYEKMMEEMSDNYGDGTETGGADRKINTPLDMQSILDAGLYVVHYNNHWHRAIIMFIEGTSFPESIELYLLDLGQYIIAPLSNIRNATIDLIDYAIFAVRCQLADLHASSDFQPVMTILEERDYGDYFSVELVSKDKPISGGCLINRIRLFNILSENLAGKCTPNPLQTSTPRSVSSEQNGNDAQVVEISTSQSLSNFLTEPMKNCALNTNGAQAMETEENVTMDYDIDVTRPLLPLEIPSTEFRAFVVFAPDPSDFTIRLECAQNFPQLIRQMTETDEFICQSPIETEPIPGH